MKNYNNYNKTTSHDDWWFKNQKMLYNPDDNTYSKNDGITSRWEWYLYRLHKKKGATYKSFVEYDKHVRKTKGNGGTTDFPKNENNENPRNKYVPPRYDLEKIFDFNYKDMLNCEPNTKFDKVNNLVFNHEYYDENKNEEQEEYIERYNEMKYSGEIEKVNEIYQRLSNYITKNKLSRKFVDGSIICNVAIITSEYVANDTLNYNYDFLNNIQEYNDNEDFRFHLWLILQCFISKNIFFHKYAGGCPIVNWWALCKLHHRHSDKDMKTKGQCSGFKNNNGKYIYKKY